MDDAWKKLVEFRDKKGKTLDEHQECLETLKSSLREALIFLKQRRGEEDAKRALELMERTLQGETCCFGSQFFVFKQASVVLLNCLKLLPEPNAAMDALPRLVLQLVMQLHRQDFAVLSSFSRDIAAALRALISRPFRITAFARLSRLCKDRVQDRSPDAEQAAVPPGFSLELADDCFAAAAARFCSLARVGPEREVLQTSLLRLMAAVARWAVEGRMEAAGAERVLHEGLAALAELRRGVPSCQVQSEIGNALPAMLRFARHRTSLGPALAVLLEAMLAEHSAALMLPQLPSIMSLLLMAAEKATWSLRPLAHAVRRFGEAPLRCPAGFDAAWLQAALKDPDAASTLAELAPALRTANVLPDSAPWAALAAGSEQDGPGAASPLVEALLLTAGSSQSANRQETAPRLLAELLAKNGAGTVHPQNWRRLLRALDAFSDVKLLQELLASTGWSPAPRAALWLALAKALRLDPERLQRVLQEEKDGQASGQGALLKIMGEEAKACGSTQWASLASALTAFIAADWLSGEECREDEATSMLDAVFGASCVRPLAALPTPLESAPNPLRRRAVFGRERPRPAQEVPGDVLHLCAFCNTAEPATSSSMRPHPGLARSCSCGAELLPVDLSLPSELRSREAQRRKLRRPQELMSVVLKLRARLASTSAPATALGLLEPSDSQPSPGSLSKEVARILSTAVLCLCAGCSKPGLTALAKDLATFFPSELDSRRIPSNSEAPEPLAALLSCKDFRASLFEAEISVTPSAKRRRGEAHVSQPLQVLALSSQQLTQMVDGATRMVNSTSDAVTSSASLQRLLRVCMLTPVCSDELFLEVDRSLYLRFLERSSKSVRAASLCQLLLKGSLKSKMRLLLPKILPLMVLHEQMDGMQHLCKLLDEESIPSVFTPNLPFVLSEIALLPANRVACSLAFLISRVYKNSVSADSLSAAFLGKALVLILWESARLPAEERLSQTTATLTNIAQALQSRGRAAEEWKRPDPMAERSTKKRRAGEKEAKVIDVAGGTPPEVLQILERNFLHVLDILTIILDRRSPKWQEYCALLSDPFGHITGDGGDIQASGPDMPRFCQSLSLLLELLRDNLHRFASKIFELLQESTAQSSQHPASLDCWRHFVTGLGIQRLKPLLPAVVSELLRLGAHLKVTATRSFQALGQEVLSPLVLETCRSAGEVVPSLPDLPPWEMLRTAKAALDKARTPGSATSARLERCVQQLQDATQQVVRRSALEGLRTIIQDQRQKSSCTVSTQLPKPTLARLMRALLKFLWESSASPDDQLLCGQLLGSLGAVDPASFSGQVLVERHNPATENRSRKGDVDLAKTILQDFLASSLTSRNNYAFAVQEIFRYLKPGGQDQLLLSKIEREDVREALRPYMSSSYERVSSAWRASQGPATLEDALVAASKLLPAERRAFFEACMPAVPGNHALTLFLMHHALPDLLTGPAEGSELSSLADHLAALLRGGAEPRHSATTQAVFSLLDDLFQRQEEVKATPVNRIGDETWKSRQMQRVELLLAPFAPRLVVEAALRCGAHARALQFLEEDLIDQALHRQQNIFDMEGPRISEADCELLQKIYLELGEADGVVGVLRIGPASGRTRRPELELQGRWADVQACYELATEGPERTAALCGLVRCTQATRRYESSLRLIAGIQQEQPDLGTALRPQAVEAAWQLGSWDRLAKVLQEPMPDGPCDFQVKLGRAVLAVHNRDTDLVATTLRETTLEVARAASAAARESYTRAYQHLLRLHVLSDIEWLSKQREDPSSSKPGELAKNLLARCDITTPSFSVRQTLLRPLSVLLQDLELREDAKTLELAFARLCRKHKQPVSMEHPDSSFQGTSDGLRRAAQIEWGKILFANGARTDALRHARRCAQRDAKARLLGTRWAAEASLLLPRVAEVEFQEAKEQLKDSEAACFYHAAYLDGLLKGQISEAEARGTVRSENCPFDRKNLATFTVRGYLQALQRGTKRVHFILNRVLQLSWECCEVDFFKAEVNTELTNEGRRLMPGMWYTVLSQLISRALQPDMRPAFREIIKNVVMKFPDPAGWHLMQLLKSDDKGHQQLGKELLGDVARENRDLHALFSQRLRIAEDLISLANCSGAAETLRLSKTFPRLAGAQSYSRSDRWRVLVPIQGQMTATIPRLNSAEQLRAANEKSCFFPDAIMTERCLEMVEVFRSKEKPKKLTFLGSDGHQYPFLCKAEKRGDLRKDSRLMEFAVMVNQLLAKSPDANRRNLEVRTFQVVILSEKCGLIEWVPNTKGLRFVIDDLWKFRKGPRQSPSEVKDLLDRSKDPYETFTRQVLPRNPPILHRWFARSGDPSIWLAKRTLFSQSQALWCMLGYLVGLGDRHGENILIDTESGRMVHVDFDCLFGKGMLLEKPEMVPFRLTQNCVAAMGITGVEGSFRQCCEVAMEVLRDSANTQTLLSVLHVFVADPLLEITRKPANTRDLAEHRVQLARHTIGEVEKKLNGMLNVGAVVPPRGKDGRESVLSKDERLRSSLGRDRGAGLSVQGQVDELIKAATCKRNLSEMYVGWQPWL